jgi:hypothetical protein
MSTSLQWSVLIGAVVALGCAVQKDDEDGAAYGRKRTIPIEQGSRPAGGSTDAAGVSVFTPDNAASLGAFRATLLPLLEEHCGGCHGAGTSPFFAVDDAYLAHKTVIESHLVAPSAVPSSRLVTRLSLNNHNCWSECSADAAAMQAAIQAWVDRGGIKGGGEGLLRVGSLKIEDAEEIRLPGTNGNWVREAENFDALGDGFEVIDDTTASLEKAIERRQVEEGQQAPAGEVSYSFPIPEGESYALWFRVRDVGRGGAIQYRVNGGAPAVAFIEGDPDGWAWIPAFEDTALKPLARSDVVTVAIMDAEVTIDMLAITEHATFDRGLIENTGYRQALRFDLSGALGTEASLLLHLAGGPDGASYILSHPTLELEGGASVTLEGLHIMVNGQFNPQYSTFAALSATVSETTELSPRGLLIVSDDGDDTITLGFGKLELAK